ncbi:MAG: hypothetical protein WCH13_17825, partial [Deltaproteobacteria bacterium]
MGIAGFPGSGKTTIFNALTGLHADTGLGSGAGGKPNLGVIKVPDERVDALSGIFTPKKKTYAEMSFVDFPDPPTEGGRLDEKVIVQMREVEALLAQRGEAGCRLPLAEQGQQLEIAAAIEGFHHAVEGLAPIPFEPGQGLGQGQLFVFRQLGPPGILQPLAKH